MNKLRSIEMFSRLVELGSFTRVAEQFGTSKSMISKEISRLEDDLGVRLLHRTTRNLQLTHAGEGYLQYAREVLNKLAQADAFVRDIHQRPKGKLKINAPMTLGLTDLATVFSDFMKAYPDISLEIHLGDEEIDLVEQGFDLGFRASSREFDSSYVGRPLTTFSYITCVSHDYFDTHPAIETAQDLLAHNCFEYSYFKGKNVWPIGDGVAINGSLKANSGLLILEAIKAGHGVGMLPEFACQKALDSGQVIEILKEVKRPTLTLYALYPVRHLVPTKVITCIEFVQNWFNENYPPS
ncbi:LysR family transcriptional regulator (plasmid) [Pseudoalteromonas sp. T1lg65]|uniref:LysR family transcriptional regulator n=1 Tax=Pseudoalteromonas sp. T1lg65 TaxID=2077101 RepID=UPI003F7AF610